MRGANGCIYIMAGAVHGMSHYDRSVHDELGAASMFRNGRLEKNENVEPLGLVGCSKSVSQLDYLA